MPKMSVNMSPDVIQVIRDLAKKRSTTMTEVIKHAIGTEKFISDIVHNGGKILIEVSDGGEIRQLVWR